MNTRLMLSVCVLAAGSAIAHAAPPNVVFLLSDDQGWADYGFMGHPKVQTPNLDRLAGDGLLYERGYVTAPLCRPSLASIVTGLYPHQTAVRGNDPAMGKGISKQRRKDDPMLRELARARRQAMTASLANAPSMVKQLRDNGYATLQTGKWWEGNPLDHAFTDGMTQGGRAGDRGLKIGRETMQPIYDFVDKAQAKEQPFFIWYSVYLPHSPHNAPERLYLKYKDLAPDEPTARYWANIAWLDETCGQLVDYLKEKGLYDNTLFVYTCDNGWVPNPERVGKYMRSKREPVEAGVRTPIFLTHKNRIKPRRDAETLASNIDIAPTILRACGIEPDAAMSGLDLRDTRALATRGRIFVDVYEHDTDVDAVGDRDSNLTARVVIDGWDKLIARPDGKELYDLKNDPDDRRDISTQNPEKVEELSGLIDVWLKATPFVSSLKSRSAANATEKKRDVVFIVLDDLNDWVGVLGGHPQCKTPNIDALAARGVLFTNAHCNAPTCNPSRKSFLSGLYPKSNGKYFNGGNKLEKDRPPFFGDQPMKGATSKSAPKSYPYLHQHFKSQGYRVVSGGKMAHGPIAGLVGEESLDAFANRKDKGFASDRATYVSDRRNVLNQPGASNHEDSQTSDYKIAHWAIGQWHQVTDEPLLMTIGIFRPHTPLTAPKACFDKFPLESIQLPKTPSFDDSSDLPEYAKWLARYTNFELTFAPRSTHEEILRRGEEEWRYMVQSYLACISYADAQVGHLLEALKKNPRGRETMIILTGDHGWHLGEKRHWCKSALWRDTTRVPYIVVALGVARPGAVNGQPVSLVDTYPTLCDFAGIPKPEHLDGESLIPLLQDPKATRKAAFISYGPENTAMQTERYRYIRYEDGSEELYDQQKDPHEWTNLSNNPEFAALKAKLKTEVLKFQSE